MKKNSTRQSGAISIFIVMFFMIVMTIGVVSFTRIMLVNQRQATNSDLNQSAYDSALAGVEDAKRLLLWTRANATVPGLKDAIERQACNTNQILSDIVRGSGASVDLKQPSAVGDLSQGYTCVKINPNTPDYLGSTDGDVRIVPLEGTSDFNQVRVSWFTNKDNATISLPPVGQKMDFPQNSSWPANRPGLMRVQISYSKDGSFRSSDFISNGAAGKTSGSLTGFFYPKSSTIKATKLISNDNNIAIENSVTSLQSGDCSAADFAAGGYACSAIIDIQGSANIQAVNKAYLNLTPIYSSTSQSFKVELLSAIGGSTTIVPFKNVQPEVDATGRSNDVYRRVLARVALDGSSTYMKAGVNAVAGSTPANGSGNFCKDFYVGDAAADTNFNNVTGCSQ